MQYKDAAKLVKCKSELNNYSVGYVARNLTLNSPYRHINMHIIFITYIYKLLPCRTKQTTVSNKIII